MLQNQTLPIVDITPLSMQDYPDTLSCILWFSGCNFRCPYCHNPKLIKKNSSSYLNIENIKQFLKKRKNLLDAVVLTGGEVSINHNNGNIIKLLQFIKQNNFLIKLDTNGSNYTFIQDLLNLKLLDYVAIDFKAPQQSFKLATGQNKQSQKFYDNLINSIILLNTHQQNHKKFKFEIRTTVHSSITTTECLKEIQKTLKNINKNNNNWYIQYANNSSENLTNLGKNTITKNEIHKKLNNKHLNFRYFN